MKVARERRTGRFVPAKECIRRVAARTVSEIRKNGTARKIAEKLKKI